MTALAPHKPILTVADLIARVAQETSVPVAEISGDSLRQEAIEARQLVAWLGGRSKRWGYRNIGLSLNRTSDQVRKQARHAQKRWMRDRKWQAVANRILLDISKAQPTEEPSPPPRQEVSRNSAAGPPISDVESNWGFQRNSPGRAYLQKQNDDFARAMRKAGYGQTGSAA